MFEAKTDCSYFSIQEKTQLQTVGGQYHMFNPFLIQ